MIEKLKTLVDKRLSSEPTFVFVGPPSSGKTVYFTCAMDLLKRLLSTRPNSGWTLQTDDKETLKRHKSSLAAMKKGGWPDKTTNPYKLYYQLSRRIGIGKLLNLATFNTRVVYHDYPGEAFSAAFDDGPTDKHWESEAEKLKDDIKSAKGVFVIIDTPKLHNGEDEKYNLQLFSLLKFIESDTKVKRIGVIFTKRDFFVDYHEFDPITCLREQYDDAWIFLKRMDAKYFFVSAVSKPIFDHDCNLVPPKRYETSMSENLVEPLAWALRISL